MWIAESFVSSLLILVSSYFGITLSDRIPNTTDKASYVQRKSICYQHFLRNCDNSKDEARCLDNFNKILRYNDRGCISSIEDCSCATYEDSKGTLEMGRCFYNCMNKNLSVFDDTLSYTTLPRNPDLWNGLFCGNFKRSGALCGNCQQDHYLQAYSFNLSCIECADNPSHWVKYVLFAYLPLTCLCFFILFSKLIVPSTLLHGFVLYSQLVSTPSNVKIAMILTQNQTFTYPIVQIVAAIYGIWNLDFLRTFSLGICLKTSTLKTLSLDLAIAIYPLAFIALTSILIHLYDAKYRLIVILWEPVSFLFKCIQKHSDMKASTVDCFATFMLLSSVKLLNVCFDILIPVQVFAVSAQGNASISWRVYNNASVPYFGSQHLPYAITAITVILTNICIPTLILLLYPFRICQRFLHTFPSRWQLVIHTLVDSFQGCYKDGTQAGKVDYRIFSASPFIIRMLFFIIYAITLNVCFYPLSTILCVLFCLFFVHHNPLKAEHYSTTTIIFILLLASFGVCCCGHGMGHSHSQYYSTVFSILAALFGSLPLLYLILYLIISFLFRVMRYSNYFVHKTAAVQLYF